MADHDLFFSRTGMDRGRVQQTVDKALKGSDDGELYLEYSQSESFSYDDNRLKAASFDTIWRRANAGGTLTRMRPFGAVCPRPMREVALSKSSRRRNAES